MLINRRSKYRIFDEKKEKSYSWKSNSIGSPTFAKWMDFPDNLFLFSLNHVWSWTIGDSKKSAPLLKGINLKDPKKIFDELLRFISYMYKKAELVHADLSPYNILIYRNKPYVIDVGQGVLLEHPSSHEFLKRDIHNTVQYFSKFGIIKDEKEIFEQIIKKGD